jgi:hypothetical protein
MTYSDIFIPTKTTATHVLVQLYWKLTACHSSLHFTEASYKFQFVIIQFLFVFVPTQQPKGQLQSEHE